MTAASVLIAALCALWVVQAALIFRHLTQIRDLASLAPPDPAMWPKVSVISAARNEAADIGRSLASRLADGYPDLEVVIVDDRSDDGTPQIIADFARRDPRVRAVRVDELPDGWLGKVHALAAGVEASTGEWLLFSDADVTVEPGMVARSVAYCEAEHLDLLALVPEFRSKSLVVNALWAIFMRVISLVVSPAAVRDPGSKTAMGSGGYTLVRRSSYDATPGFSHLRLETADDVALGVMVKQAGGRCDFLNGRHAASVCLYASPREFFEGVEKNGSSLAGTPFSLLALVFAGLGCLEFSPLIAVGVGLGTGAPWLAWTGVATTALATVATVAALHRNTGMVLPGILWPVGWPLMAFGLLRSAWLFHRRGGAVWRGTFYPKADVLEAQRFKVR